MTEKHTCDGVFFSGYYSYRCGVGAKHEHEGRWYCKTHHPPTVKAKCESREEELRKKRNAERDAAQAKKLAADEQKRRADCYDGLLEALHAYQHAFDGIFTHCLSNGVFNAWQQAMDCTELNEASLTARAAISKATGEHT